jgi:hypothetical protein
MEHLDRVMLVGRNTLALRRVAQGVVVLVVPVELLTLVGLEEPEGLELHLLYLDHLLHTAVVVVAALNLTLMVQPHLVAARVVVLRGRQIQVAVVAVGLTAAGRLVRVVPAA